MSDANKDFAEFGKKSLILAILYFISFIIGIIAIAVSEAGYVNMVIGIVIIVFLIIAAGSVGKAGDKLNNDDLKSFRTRIIVSVILVTLGIIMATVAFSIIMATIQGPDPGSPEAVTMYITFGIVALIGIVIIIIGAIFELLAWTDLKGFFRDNVGKFPEDIGKSAQTGALLGMIGAILTLTFILAFLGSLLRAIGYFMLAKLKDLE